ncbi:MAG: sigma-70 family RNA polymerase sigma factor [Peptococcaceae bacterium]|nr:sigma-70 family RNA polymerase sigma factor [Peptococcaceae bacterium]
MREEITLLIERYQDNLFAAAFSICKNAADANDIVQETFLQYYTIDKEFETEQHIKAWLIRVAINKAKNINLSFWKRKRVSMEDYINTLAFETPEDGPLFEEVMGLPEKYRIIIHLFYYEDYSIREIANILKISEANVKVRLTRGRTLLKKTLKEEWNDDDQ